ncbi:membrane protein [Pedobacter antarcticus 4BY]|uniref:Membrane protein n=2 Tax=Pedobacter antarcticus TaxID=34086 RepID=A0A081PIP9_9SPHI|nr:hypothetical protein [Pedobacter antarcticus]KEQ30572.1 membrane protein [Pedobacter antarcticus 4BY]SFF18192.1 hypothetical protein SAMN03003324_02716 [Pedobacter antarcticus]
MKEDIRIHLNDSRQLEKMYRANKNNFKREFSELYPELKGNALADFWNERLNYENEEINWGTGRELGIVIIASLFAGLIARLPDLLPITDAFFYPRNTAFVIFPLLTAYFAWKNKLSVGKIVFIVFTIIAGMLLINFLPDVRKSDTLILACIHLPLFLWSVLGFAFVGGRQNNEQRRLGFLKYNGDLIVMTTLILISGAILTGITIGLFSLIGFNIEEYYFKNVAVFGLAAAPIIGTYLTQTNPQLVGKVSPVIAKLFSPLVVVMLSAYLIAILYSGKDPYQDRDFLLIFNALLIGVLAIIFFSIAETSNSGKSRVQTGILFILSVLTVLVNGIALSAILFRISEFGITPNRIAVLGGNMLILINLLLVTLQLFRVLAKKSDITSVGKSISFYLPVYFIWTIIVTFFFPFIFGFK